MDITDIFWESVYRKVDVGEINNIAIRGEVATGKSSAAIYGSDKLNKYIVYRGHRKTLPDMKRTIFADQTEFLRFIKSDIRDLSIVIDEFNRLADTGLNASTESTVFDYYSDVFAQRNTHRWTCSPYTVIDKNCTIILDVIGRDKKAGTTTLKVQYRDPLGKISLTIGHVVFPVIAILDTEYYASRS